MADIDTIELEDALRAAQGLAKFVREEFPERSLAVIVETWTPADATPEERTAIAALERAGVFESESIRTSRRSFTDDERFAVARAIRDWVHKQPWSECGMGTDTCPDWPVAFEIRDVALGALQARSNGGV